MKKGCKCSRHIIPTMLQSRVRARAFDPLATHPLTVAITVSAVAFPPLLHMRVMIEIYWRLFLYIHTKVELRFKFRLARWSRWWINEWDLQWRMSLSFVIDNKLPFMKQIWLLGSLPVALAACRSSLAVILANSKHTHKKMLTISLSDHICEWEWECQ